MAKIKTQEFILRKESPATDSSFIMVWEIVFTFNESIYGQPVGTVRAYCNGVAMKEMRVDRDVFHSNEMYFCDILRPVWQKAIEDGYQRVS